MSETETSLVGSLLAPLCRFGHHDYLPQYVVRMDAIGLGDDRYPLRMRWRCSRCGEECTLPAGVSP